MHQDLPALIASIGSLGKPRRKITCSTPPNLSNPPDPDDKGNNDPDSSRQDCVEGIGDFGLLKYVPGYRVARGYID